MKMLPEKFIITTRLTYVTLFVLCLLTKTISVFGDGATTTTTTINTNSTRTAELNASNEEVLTFESADSVSFGIRSFTVEVTTASDKLQPASNNPDVNRGDQDNRSSSSSETIISAAENEKFGNVQDDDDDENHISNEIHVEKKLKNGLYRIKIAEITTDEFDNGLMSADNENMPRDIDSFNKDSPDFHHIVTNAQHAYNGGKINIDDLYPSKLEDFKTVIQESNEKLIKEKAAFRKTNTQPDSVSIIPSSFNFGEDSDENKEKITKEDNPTENIPTSKIEIELIDDVTPNLRNGEDEQTVDKSSDIMKKLQENDEVISKIEENFKIFDETKFNWPVPTNPPNTMTPMNIASDVTTPATISTTTTTTILTTAGAIAAATETTTASVSHSPAPTAKIQMPPTKMEFIDRRVKKNDPSMKFYANIKKVANTKFSSDTDTAGNNSSKPEFSTTKFYNSKELYGDSEHKNLTPKNSAGSDNSDSESPSTSTIASTNVFKPTTTVAMTSTEKEFSTTTKSSWTRRTSMLMNKMKQNPTSQQNRNSTDVKGKDKNLNEHKNVPAMQIKSKEQVLRTNKVPKSDIVHHLKNTIVSVPLSSSTSPSQINAFKSRGNYPSTTISDDKTLTSLATTVGTPTKNRSPLKATANIPTFSTSTLKQEFARPNIFTRLQEKINALECDIQTMPQGSSIWRGNETHELNLPVTTPKDCSSGTDCLPMIISWEGTAEIQSGDVLIVEIDDSQLIPPESNNGKILNLHRTTTAVYQVTRLGHEHCDVTEGVLLDITPLVVDGKKLVTLYDKDLTEGINLLIVVSELWGQQCVRLSVTVKSDNCGENADCSGKGICFSNTSMEGYECQCCGGFAGSHCEEIDACTPSPCTNNGICVDLSQGHEGNAYQCLCPYGYTGKNCQFESDPCNPSQCMNGGSCIGNSTHFRCECPPGYTGPLCQHNLNECESSPCVHGICVDQEDGFRCFCQPGFSGELCNFEYNECESNPCINGAQCTDHIGGYSCKCTRGYTGKRCDIKVDFCVNNPCPEGHRCVDRGDDFTCECPGGRNGPDCNQIPRTMCNVNPCANGGTCWASEESFYCACRPGFTGKMCEDEFIVDTVVSSKEILSDIENPSRTFSDSSLTRVGVTRTPIELHNAYIAAGTLVAAIIIVAIVVTVCHCKVHQTYRRFATKHHQLIPIFGFGRRNKSATIQRHWLSGKGAQTNNKTNVHNGLCHQQNNGQHHNSIYNGHDRTLNRPLAMNLENDMYYTVDFSDSQNSPLIQ